MMNESPSGMSVLSVQGGTVSSSPDLNNEAANERYELIMPIKLNDDPSLCRDEFLRQLFANINLPDDEVKSNEEVLDDDDDSDDFGDNVDDTLRIVPLLGKVGSRGSNFSLAPNYITKKEVNFASFLRKRDRIATHDAELKRISTTSIEGDINKLNLTTGSVNKYENLYQSMSRSALFIANTRILYRVLILQRSPLNSNQMDMDLESIPHNLFSWSLEEFFKRRELKDFVYLDVLVRSQDWAALDSAKYRCDLLEIIRILQFFYNEMVKGEGYRKMLSILWEQKQLLTVDKSMEKSITEGYEELATATSKSKRFSQAWWNQYKNNATTDMQRNLIDLSVRVPIEMRYMKAYYETLVETEGMQCDMKTNEFQQDVNRLNETMKAKEIAASVAWDVYHGIIENYKERINHFTKRLETDTEHWDDKILLTSFQLAKAKDDLKQAEERLAFMRRRIIEVQAQIAAENEEEIYRLANEQELVKQKIENEKKAKQQKALEKQRKTKAKRAAAVAKRQKHNEKVEETNDTS